MMHGLGSRARCAALVTLALAAKRSATAIAVAARASSVKAPLIPSPRATRVPPIASSPPSAWRQAWRAIFHARVHQALDALALTPAAIRPRINDIGQLAFDEIRLVLRQEDLLLPPADDTTTYVEFVALYLELRAFAPRTRHSAATGSTTIARSTRPTARAAASIQRRNHAACRSKKTITAMPPSTGRVEISGGTRWNILATGAAMWWAPSTTKNAPTTGSSTYSDKSRPSPVPDSTDDTFCKNRR